MNILQAMNRLPDSAWRVQSLQSCFLRGEVKKKTASSLTFQTTPELVQQMNLAAATGSTPKQIGMIVWVDASEWEKAKALARPTPEPKPAGEIKK